MEEGGEGTSKWSELYNQREPGQANRKAAAAHAGRPGRFDLEHPGWPCRGAQGLTLCLREGASGLKLIRSIASSFQLPDVKGPGRFELSDELRKGMCQVVGLGSCSALLQLAMHGVFALFFVGSSFNESPEVPPSELDATGYAGCLVRPLGYKRKPTKQRIKIVTPDKKKQSRGNSK